MIFILLCFVGLKFFIISIKLSQIYIDACIPPFSCKTPIVPNFQTLHLPFTISTINFNLVTSQYIIVSVFTNFKYILKC